MKPNITEVTLNKTANTCLDCAMQRAENIFLKERNNVLELCVGPSLRKLQECYSKFGIKVTGNDIDIRWKHYFINGNWIVGNCLELLYRDFDFDTIVFAPPLSKGCSGTRKDSLSVEKVFPKYKDFLEIFLKSQNSKLKTIVLVLPGRSLATTYDRKEFYNLISLIQQKNLSFELVPLKSENIVKYYDIYIDFSTI